MDLKKYQQAKSGAMFSLIEGAELLYISGADRINFLQRQSTNDLNSLKAGSIIQTVLTSPTARILDVLMVFTTTDEQTLCVLPLPDRVLRTEKFLKSRIFFMDKVTVKRAEDAFVHFELDGPFAAEKLQAANLAIETIPLPGEIKRLELAGFPAHLLRENLQNTKFRLLLPPDGKDQAMRILERNGFILIDEAERELMRIEAGIAGEKNELTEEFTPLETGLQGIISSNKGCYTGQEIIARQITYDKITRGLVGLHLQSAVQTGNPVMADGKPAGVVTSAAISPTFGPIALAVLKRPFYDTGAEICVQVEMKEVSGRVSALPFQ